jgi:hypothetical protein
MCLRIYQIYIKVAGMCKMFVVLEHSDAGYFGWNLKRHGCLLTAL